MAKFEKNLEVIYFYRNDINNHVILVKCYISCMFCNTNGKMH